MKKTFLFLCALCASLLAAHADNADLNKQIRELSRSKMKLTMKISSALNEHKLQDNPKLKKAEQEAFLASRKLNKAKKEHPALKEYIAKSDAAQKKMIDAGLANDQDARKAATKEFTAARMELEKAARKIPEIHKLTQEAIEINNAVNAAEIEVLATVPEGKKLIDEIEALDKQIKELRAKLQK